eukprot:COSAG01_NODE_1015_length_12114_cov_214.545651_9_plen_72_part_00
MLQVGTASEAKLEWGTVEVVAVVKESVGAVEVVVVRAEVVVVKESVGTASDVGAAQVAQRWKKPSRSGCWR